MKPKYKRKQLWVDGPFQTRLLLRMVTYFVAYLVVVLHVGFVFEFLGHLTGTGPRHSVEELYFDFLGRQTLLLFTLLLVAPVMLYDLLKFSHRVAGPLFRCRKVMKEMAQGKAVGEFTPRKHDLMGELFQAFNELICEWNRRLRAETNGHTDKPASALADNGRQAQDLAGRATTSTPA